MAKKDQPVFNMKKAPSFIGSWAFLVGVILAVVVGLFGLLAPTYQHKEVFAIILIVLGLIVGFFNVTGKEVEQFLIAGTVLVIVGSLGQDVLAFIPRLNSVLTAITIMFVPSTILVAVKHVFNLARD
jgi:uncharacterized membrane protein